MDDSGRLPSASGHSAKPEPVPVSAAIAASIPSADSAVLHAFNMLCDVREREEELWRDSAMLRWVLERGLSPEQREQLAQLVNDMRVIAKGEETRAKYASAMPKSAAAPS